MEVGRLAHGKAYAFVGHIVQPIARLGDATLGFRVERDSGFAAGRGGAPAALTLDQRLHAIAAIADDLGRSSDRGGNKLVSDDYQPQVIAVVEAIDDDAIRLGGIVADGERT